MLNVTLIGLIRAVAWVSTLDDTTSLGVLDNQTMQLGYIFQKAIGLNVKDQCHTFSLSSN